MRKDFDRVTVSARGNVAVITLNHPEVINAISPRMACANPYQEVLP